MVGFELPRIAPASGTIVSDGSVGVGVSVGVSVGVGVGVGAGVGVGVRVGVEVLDGIALGKGAAGDGEPVRSGTMPPRFSQPPEAIATALRANGKTKRSRFMPPTRRHGARPSRSTAKSTLLQTLARWPSHDCGR